MKLDRNITTPKRGKYALIKLRDVTLPLERLDAETVGVPLSAIDLGDTEDTDFFVIRLKDMYAFKALRAYADEAEKDDPEYAKEIRALAEIARMHPNRRKPD